MRHDGHQARSRAREIVAAHRTRKTAEAVLPGLRL